MAERAPTQGIKEKSQKKIKIVNEVIKELMKEGIKILEMKKLRN